MNDKYKEFGKDYKDTVAILAETTGWTVKQTRKVLDLLAEITQKQAAAATRKQRTTQKNAKSIAARNLLENYRNLKVSIQCGTEHSLRLLEDSEYLRLMQDEESPVNQGLRSTALLTASNRVLWTRLNAALDCYKEMCEHDPKPQIRRGYPLIYARYLAEKEAGIDDILDSFAIEKSQYYLCMGKAYSALGVILFGSDCAEDFCAGTSK